jgi:hypothetical protein
LHETQAAVPLLRLVAVVGRALDPVSGKNELAAGIREAGDRNGTSGRCRHLTATIGLVRDADLPAYVNRIV